MGKQQAPNSPPPGATGRLVQVHPREPLGTMPGTKLVPDKQYSVILLLLPAVAALKHGCTLFDTPSIERWGSVSPP